MTSPDAIAQDLILRGCSCRTWMTPMHLAVAWGNTETTSARVGRLRSGTPATRRPVQVRWPALAGVFVGAGR